MIVFCSCRKVVLFHREVVVALIVSLGSVMEQQSVVKAVRSVSCEKVDERCESERWCDEKP